MTSYGQHFRSENHTSDSHTCLGDHVTHGASTVEGDLSVSGKTTLKNTVNVGTFENNDGVIQLNGPLRLSGGLKDTKFADWNLSGVEGNGDDSHDYYQQIIFDAPSDHWTDVKTGTPPNDEYVRWTRFSLGPTGPPTTNKNNKLMLSVGQPGEEIDDDNSIDGKPRAIAVFSGDRTSDWSNDMTVLGTVTAKETLLTGGIEDTSWDGTDILKGAASTWAVNDPDDTLKKYITIGDSSIRNWAFAIAETGARYGVTATQPHNVLVLCSLADDPGSNSGSHRPKAVAAFNSLNGESAFSSTCIGEEMTSDYFTQMHAWEDEVGNISTTVKPVLKVTGRARFKAADEEAIETEGDVKIGGNLEITGTATVSGGTTVTSDDRFKNNEELLTQATDTIRKLKPQIYDKQQGNEGSQRESGLIAQEVWYDAPELRHLVHLGKNADDTTPTPQPMDLSAVQPGTDPDYGNNGWSAQPSGLNYTGLIAYLIKSNQELAARLDALELK